MSAKIAVLPLEVANRIAAGEVVERPASAVKELVENSLDAGARRITVEVAEAGRRLIRVTDDGEGMAPDDAKTALLRHATSKIRTDADLFRIRTLGFRGEALPSIAAVSKMRLVTMVAGDSCGTELRAEGGSIKEEREAAVAPGTVVEVSDLFFNTPARKKFLKSPATEFGHICQTIQRHALGFPEVQFRLVHNGAAVLEYPPVHSLRERAQQVYGLSFVDGAVDVMEEDADVRLEGLCSRPLDSGVSKHPQEILVNHRWIKCPSLAHAVYEAYGSYLPKGRSPRFVLALSLDPHSVDMNVHPTKREVRFSDHEQLHALIHKRLRRAIGPGVTVTVAAARNASDGTPEPIGPSRSGMGVEIPYSQVRDPLPPRVAEPVQGYLPAVGAEVRPLGQIADRYVLAQIEQELHIVDQHTAHERVLFERLCTELERGMIPSQRSLLPQTIELPSHAAILLRAHLLELERLGFEVEDFGGGAFFVRAVPALFGESGGACDSLLHALLEEWEEEGSTASLRERYHAPLATVACHSAVRSGRKLEPAEIQRLLEGWQDAGLPSTCPHGRRIAMRLTIEELDRIFGRAGWK